MCNNHQEVWWQWKMLTKMENKVTQFSKWRNFPEGTHMHRERGEYRDHHCDHLKCGEWTSYLLDVLAWQLIDILILWCHNVTSCSFHNLEMLQSLSSSFIHFIKVITWSQERVLREQWSVNRSLPLYFSQDSQRKRSLTIQKKTNLSLLSSPKICFPLYWLEFIVL